MKKSRSLFIGMAAAACTLAACGSSSSVSSSASKAATATVAAGGAAADGTTADAGTTTDSGTTGGATATTKAAATGGGNGSKFCALSAQFQAKYSNGGAFGNLSTDKPADMKAFFTTFDSDITAWEAAAPADIKPAIASQTKSIVAIEALLKKYDYDFAKAAADPNFAVAADAAAGTAAAGAVSADEQITTYMKDKCGLADTSGDSSSTTTG